MNTMKLTFKTTVGSVSFAAATLAGADLGDGIIEYKSGTGRGLRELASFFGQQGAVRVTFEAGDTLPEDAREPSGEEHAAVTEVLRAAGWSADIDTFTSVRVKALRDVAEQMRENRPTFAFGQFVKGYVQQVKDDCYEGGYKWEWSPDGGFDQGVVTLAPDCCKFLSRVAYDAQKTASVDKRIAHLVKQAIAKTSLSGKAYIDIRDERARQVAKGRDAAHDDARSMQDWVSCAYAVINSRVGLTAREVWVKLGSVAVSAVESIDRKAGHVSKEAAEKEDDPMLSDIQEAIRTGDYCGAAYTLSVLVKASYIKAVSTADITAPGSTEHGYALSAVSAAERARAAAELFRDVITPKNPPSLVNGRPSCCDRAKTFTHSNSDIREGHDNSMPDESGWVIGTNGVYIDFCPWCGTRLPKAP